MKLSHSSKSKYKECPARYDFHYNKRYRTKSINSSLFFGSAFDEAVSRLLLDKKKELTPKEELDMMFTAKELFDRHMTITSVNGVAEIIPDFLLSNYTRADMDVSLLDDSDLHKYNDKFKTSLTLEGLKNNGLILDEYYRSSPSMLEIEVLQRNYIAWLCLYKKGLMLIDEYETNIMPKIHEVYSVQKVISLKNENDDEITGLIDIELSFIDEPDVRYIVDNKTASVAYKPKDLDESEQLNLYAYAEGVSNIAYIVAEKAIRKRDPRVRVNILKGEVDEIFAESVIDEFEDILTKIENKEFKPNFKSGCVFFGRQCEYYSICHHDVIPDSLIVLPKKEDN